MGPCPTVIQTVGRPGTGNLPSANAPPDHPLVRRSCGNFQCRGILLMWVRVGQGPTALAVGAGWGCLDIFSLVYHFSFLSPSLEDGPIQTEILSQRAVKPKTNKPTDTPSLSFVLFLSCSRARTYTHTFERGIFFDLPHLFHKSVNAKN